MPNPRRTLTALHSPLAPPTSRPLWRRRWLVWIAAVLLGLGVLAFLDGGEQPLRPMATPVSLPEQGQ